MGPSPGRPWAWAGRGLPGKAARTKGGWPFTRIRTNPARGGGHCRRQAGEAADAELTRWRSRLGSSAPTCCGSGAVPRCPRAGREEGEAVSAAAGERTPRAPSAPHPAVCSLPGVLSLPVDPRLRRPPLHTWVHTPHTHTYCTCMHIHMHAPPMHTHGCAHHTQVCTCTNRHTRHTGAHTTPHTGAHMHRHAQVHTPHTGAHTTHTFAHTHTHACTLTPHTPRARACAGSWLQLPGPAPTLMVTLPLAIFLMLKPTVGIMSSLNCPDCRESRSWKGPQPHRPRRGSLSSLDHGAGGSHGVQPRGRGVTQGLGASLAFSWP